MRTRHDRLLDLSERRLALGIEAGIIHRRIEDEALDGGTITIDGERLAYFGSCAYLALNRDDRLKAAAIDATRRYGTSYSSSPTYTALPLYDTLEERLRRMTGGAVVVAQTTTLAHIAALPIMVAPEDLVLVDAQTHDSVHLATQALKGGGVRVESVPHSDMSALDRRLAELAGDFRHIWYLADGVYSMHGDLAPVKEVAALQGRYENLYTYYDDAHGFGWQGETGRGYVLSETPINDRMVVSAGLSKSFASLGAVLVFGDAEMAQRVRMVGGPLTFSGPVPPPDLGAAVESARIHLSPEYPERQARLLADIEWVRSEIVRRNLPVASLATSPIWFVRVGPSKPSVELTRRLMKDGFYLNASIFPAVPIGAGGVRFAQTLHNTREQLSGLLDAIERRLPEFAPSTEVIVDLRDDAEVLVDGTDISRM
jgi:7-keto-8-aminopelargonate synthetase-like enzyme